MNLPACAKYLRGSLAVDCVEANVWNDSWLERMPCARLLNSPSLQLSLSWSDLVPAKSLQAWSDRSLL